MQNSWPEFDDSKCNINISEAILWKQWNNWCEIANLIQTHIVDIGNQN